MALPRGRRVVVAAGVVLVLTAGGIAGALVAGRTPPVPALHMAGIAEDPCPPRQAFTVSVSAKVRFLPDSSVLNTATSCTAAAVAVAVAANKQWLDSGIVPGDSAMQRDLATRALLDLRLSILPNGAVVAALYPKWNYTWPRDSSWVAVALSATGHTGDALSILRFLQSAQRPDGTWAARYHTDWTGPVNDGRPSELDAVGWVPWAVSSWAATQQLTPGSAARADLERLWPMVARAADAAVRSLTSDDLPQSAMDYWEDSVQVTLGTAAPLLAGLRAASGLAGILADNADQARWRAAAIRLSGAITKNFGPTGYQRTPDAGSGADTAVTFLGPPFATPDAAVERAAGTAQRALTQPSGGLRPGTAWPGASGVAFTPETAMFGLFDAATGQQASAQRLLTWLAAHRTTLGELPEQVAPNGDPISVAPLAWTDAIVLLTLTHARSLSG